MASIGFVWTSGGPGGYFLKDSDRSGTRSLGRHANTWKKTQNVRVHIVISREHKLWFKNKVGSTIIVYN